MAPPTAAPDELAPKQIRAEKVTLGVDDALPPMRVWQTRSDFASIVYPFVTRYYVQRWQSVKTSWISPNCAAPGMPEPPAEDGPHACGCNGSSGHPEAVYGHMEIEQIWHSRADWYDEEKPERAFVPDIWRGLGPCPAAGFDSVLHAFPSFVKDARAGRLWFRIEDAARREMESVEMLHARWAVWATHVLKRRAFVSHEMVASNTARAALAGNAVGFDRMRRAYYFGYNAVGAWFDKTPEQVGLIRLFISLGVPVFYRWELQYADKQKLADLRPRQAPDEELTMYATLSGPPGPREPARNAPTQPTLALPPIALTDTELHWNTARRAPREAIDEYGFPAEEDEEVLEMFDQQEAERAASMLARYSPAPSSAPSQSTSAASAAPPPNAALSPRASPAPTPPANVAAPSWSHALTARPGLIPLHRRISMIATGVPWFVIPNVLGYFEQKDEYMLDADGARLEGRGYFAGIDWHVKLLVPAWLPPTFLARRNSRKQTQLELVEMAYHYGVAFQTVIPNWTPPSPAVPSPVEGFASREEYMRTHSHLCIDEFNLVDGNPVGSFVENWATSVSLFCQRPHARAAVEAGGLPARIARWGGVTLADILKGPSDDVQNWGTPYPIEELIDKKVVQGMDNWVEPHEIAALYGRLHSGDPKKVLSLWPDPEQFRRNWFNERGNWTAAMEVWFVERLEEIWKNRKKPVLKSRALWREEIRECKRNEDASLAKHG